MKKTILAFCLLIGDAHASLPPSHYIRPSPLSKKVTIQQPQETFKNCMDAISQATGVNIVIDKDALAKHGITQNQRVFIPMTHCNTPASELIAYLVGQIDQPWKVIVVRIEKDGSVTITAK